jgi:hypothetical protein
MSPLKTLAIASVMIFGASQLALAQNGPPSGNPNPTESAMPSGGMHKNSHKIKGAHTQKLMKNQTDGSKQQQ